MFSYFCRWGKLRIMEPYQPAYYDPGASSRPSGSSAIGCPNIAGASTSALHHSPLKQQDSTESNTILPRKKRIESLSAFRDNFQEGYRDSYWNWGKPRALKSSTAPRTSQNNILHSTSVGSRLSPTGGSALERGRLLDYRRASCGSATGLGFTGTGLYDFDGRRESILSCRSNSIAGSSSYLQLSPRRTVSPYQKRHSVVSNFKNSTHTLDSQRSTNEPPRVTGITVTNEDNVTRNLVSNVDLGHSSNPDLSERVNRKKKLKRSHVTFEETLGLKPLASHMKVRSAVDLVSLVMQEQNYFF